MKSSFVGWVGVARGTANPGLRAATNSLQWNIAHVSDQCAAPHILRIHYYMIPLYIILRMRCAYHHWTKSVRIISASMFVRQVFPGMRVGT